MKRMKRKGRMLFFLPFWLLIIAMTTGMGVIQMSRYHTYRQEYERVQAELKRERDLFRDLENQQAYLENDAYIEELARNMLGYIRPDEIVFHNVAD